MLISSYFTTIPGGRAGGGRVLDIAKIQLTQPSLVELGLRLSLAKIMKIIKHNFDVKCRLEAAKIVVYKKNIYISSKLYCQAQPKPQFN